MNLDNDHISRRDEEFVDEYLAERGLKAVPKDSVHLSSSAHGTAPLRGVAALLIEKGFDTIGNAILRQLRPEQPTGLGAMVLDVDGHTWFRAAAVDGRHYDRCNDWHQFHAGDVDPGRHRWDEIDAIEVLSHGVPA